MARGRRAKPAAGLGLRSEAEQALARPLAGVRRKLPAVTNPPQAGECWRLQGGGQRGKGVWGKPRVGFSPNQGFGLGLAGACGAERSKRQPQSPSLPHRKEGLTLTGSLCFRMKQGKPKGLDLDGFFCFRKAQAQDNFRGVSVFA